MHKLNKVLILFAFYQIVWNNWLLKIKPSGCHATLSYQPKPITACSETQANYEAARHGKAPATTASEENWAGWNRAGWWRATIKWHGRHDAQWKHTSKSDSWRGQLPSAYLYKHLLGSGPAAWLNFVAFATIAQIIQNMPSFSSSFICCHSCSKHWGSHFSLF